MVQVQDLIKKLVDEHFKIDMEAVMKDPILFGDYSTALDEAEPRVYKDIIDYEASKALFQVQPVLDWDSRGGPQLCEMQSLTWKHFPEGHGLFFNASNRYCW